MDHQEDHVDWVRNIWAAFPNIDRPLKKQKLPIGWIKTALWENSSAAFFKRPPFDCIIGSTGIWNIKGKRDEFY